MLLYGDFTASAAPNPFQVIPTEWVRAAQRRWLERERPKIELTALGVDPARGGRDEFALAPRYDDYFDEVIAYPGAAVTDGEAGADLISGIVGLDQPSIHIDIIGIGSSVYDHAKKKFKRVIPINASEKSSYRDKSGKYKMRNKRAEMHWRMRDSLDPKDGSEIALPPGNEIIADLCSARYKVTTSGILIEEKDEIKSRIGRSPDKGDAIMLCNLPIGSVALEQPESKSKWRDDDEPASGRWRV